MEVYRRITERVRGALWAHHRRLLPERQFHRILAYVYNNKYEHQIRFDKMEVVGSEWNGKVEVVTTPAGFMKRVRVHPDVEDLTEERQKQLLLSAYSKAKSKGLALMQEAEKNIYRQFLKDLKPLVLGIRDNPEFFTVSDDSIETHRGVLKSGNREVVHRTIPSAKAYQPTDAVRKRFLWEKQWLESPQGRAWSHTVRGKEYLSLYSVADRPRGAPGAKKAALPLEILAPYTGMDEGRLLRKNWVAYLDNKHVAETLWTRAKISDNEKRLRTLQKTGQAWHRAVNKEAADRW